MPLLIDFLMRLTFGLAVGMAITPHSKVTSGYYRNHLYVTLGLTALAALLAKSFLPEAFWFAVGAAAASYVGSVVCLYERADIGRSVLFVVAGLALGVSLTVAETMTERNDWPAARYAFENPPAGQSLTAEQAEELADVALGRGRQAGVMAIASRVTSGLLLGVTMAAMLLGHWYLNTPTMELAPLRRLLIAMAITVAVQAVVAGVGLAMEASLREQLPTQWLLFVTLRWAFGICGVAVLTWMAWQTLKVPNTQSATGILYVAVIGTFVGETMSVLLSAESLFPL